MAFYISTGDIRGPYRVINIVSVNLSVPVPAFGNVDVPAAARRAVDGLAVEAQRIGANGVVFITLNPQWLSAGGGMMLFACGTAVLVK